MNPFSFDNFSKRLQRIVDAIMAEEDDIERRLRTLRVFAKNAKRLYIYGAGFYGKKLYYYLVLHCLSVHGFVVTECGKEQEYLGLSLNNIADVHFQEGDRIILGLNSRHQAEISDTLNKYVENNVSCFSLDDSVLQRIGHDKDVKHLEALIDIYANSILHDSGIDISTLVNMLWSIKYDTSIC